LQIKASHANPINQKTQCLVVPVNHSRKLTGTAAALNEQADQLLSKLIKQGDLADTAGATLLLPTGAGAGARRVLLINAPTGKVSAADFEKMAAAQARTVTGTAASDCISCLMNVEVDGRDTTWKARAIASAAINATYQFNEHKSKPSKAASSLKKLTLACESKADTKPAEKGISQGSAIAAGTAVARDLGNLAPNVCTPDYLAKYAGNLRRDWKTLKVSVLDEAQMSKLKMGALLSVSAGSEQPARLISMQYNGAAASKKPYVLIGKGITFDTGGISLKPGAGMDEMKFDMCGAASVFGVMRAVVELQLPINVVGLVAAAENMPSGCATRPGDVVTSMSGQTVEILNTDAEGRLVLCDALTYAARYKPETVVDIATLTGACIVALGNDVSALMGNDDELADDLYQAGLAAGDKCWRLPIWDEYQQLLKSNFADIPNIAGRAAGSITAGCFLSRFAADYRWAHLDIAGVAWKQGGAKGATGRPVPLLMQYLLDKCS
jgi:leucyl aminopeptidase